MSKLALIVLVLVAVTAYANVLGELATCNQGCVVNSDCTDANCKWCIRGACGAGCNQQCNADADCRDTNCMFCYQGFCNHSPHHTCSGSCSDNTQCDQGGSCKMCLGGKCSADCGQPCDTAAQCLGSTCTKCINNICSKGDVPCLGSCTQNFDCVQSSFCFSCMSGQCGVGCNMNCTSDSMCLDPQCKYCTEGLCQHEPHGRKCAQSCIADADCDGDAGRCNYCVQGSCGSPCGTSCKINSDCITPGCGTCSGNQCVASGN